MNDLSAHLRGSASHDALPFHRHCPACVRERMRGTPHTHAVVPAPARAGLTALVLAVTAALAHTKSLDTAHAQQTETVPPVDEAPQMVSPEELEEQLGAPDPPPEADEQGKRDSRAGALKGGTYVVEHGDSLWRIARANLGGGPSNAQIAKEVHRLWDLNGVEIGTGTPDLIHTGQRLKLR